MSRFAPNQRIAERFVIHGWLASGGMAEVYVADMQLARGMRRRVALKRIHSNFASDPEFVAMFLAEARLSSELRHPGIVPVLDVVEAEGELIIVLDYVPGWDLASVLDRSRRGAAMPLAAAAHVGRVVCEILAYVHGVCDAQGQPRRLVHRDVNPSNVLVADDGSLRLLDFGVAKAAEKSALVQTRGIRGKLAYLAPEQAAQEPLDARTDLYGVGLILFEALTGQRALAATTEIALLEAARAADIPGVATLRPEVPDDLASAVAVLLAKDPDRRPGSAAAAAATFAALEASLGGAASIDRALERAMSGEALDPPQTELRRHVHAVMGTPARGVQGASLGLEAALAQAAGVELARPATRAEVVPDPTLQLAARTVLSPTPETSAEVVTPDARWGRRRALVAALATLSAAAIGWATLRDPGPAPLRTAAPVAGYLRVDSTPPRARVIVDGVELSGPTPMVFESPPGVERHIQLVLADHHPYTTTAAADAGQTRSLAIELRRLGGRLRVDSDPPGAQVRVAGEDRGVTPLLIEPLPRAELELQIEADGYTPVEQQVSLIETPSATVSVTLARVIDRGWLDVSVTPWAKVKLDGRWIAESTPVIGRPVAAGKHVVELENPRLGKRARRVVNIRKNARSSVIVRWE